MYYLFFFANMAALIMSARVEKRYHEPVSDKDLSYSPGVRELKLAQSIHRVRRYASHSPRVRELQYMNISLSPEALVALSTNTGVEMLEN